jgi:peptide/nickel transport system substrate-binding protein
MFDKLSFMQAVWKLRARHLAVIPRFFSRTEHIIGIVLLVAFCGSLGFVLLKLDNNYSVDVPAFAGTLREGILGTPRFLNPLLAVSDADRDLVGLVYSGLMKFDGEGNIVPALAGVYNISDDGLIYTFTIRQDATWPDGESVSADDVAFTINIAKNPSYRSPLRANWEGVRVNKVDDRTVEFVLSKPYAPFLENTTIGILPKHLWEHVQPTEFNLTDLNLQPMGSGAYSVRSYEKDSTGRITMYRLEANSRAVPRKPFIRSLTLSFYTSEEDMLNALGAGTIGSISALPAKFIPVAKSRNMEIHSLTLPRIFALFFNQSASKVLANGEVRKALELAINKQALVEEILKNEGTVIYSPIPPGTFGSLDQGYYENRAFNLDQAKQLLTADGWQDTNNDGVIEKKISSTETLALSFSIATSNSPDLVETGNLIKTMLKEIGANVELQVYEIGDFEQNVLRPRKYDTLLFGEIVGHDPDPFAFWHSSQRNDPGLNIALYANPAVDTLLEDARVVIDIETRRQKYEQFQKTLAEDNPAVFLFSPAYVYALPKTIHGVAISNISLPADRFSQITSWYVKTRKVLKIFAD